MSLVKKKRFKQWWEETNLYHPELMGLIFGSILALGVVLIFKKLF
jgi:hypothetical protein